MISIRRTALAAVIIFTFVYLFRSSKAPQAYNLDPAVDTLPAGIKGASFRFKEIHSSHKDGDASQQTIVNIADRPLREKLAYQFQYDLPTKFPAYIWQTWKYTPGSGNFEEKFREPEASWSIQHPGFVHEVITDDVAVHLIRHLYGAVPEVVEAYLALPMTIMKADFFRYLILLARGGIYSDIDTHALKPASEWLPSAFPVTSVGLVVGIEADPDRPDWHDWYPRRIQFCQWTIQAKAGHPVLVEIVANITENTLRGKASHSLRTDQDGVMDFTGPAVWTDTIMAYLNNPKFFDMKTSPGEVSWRNFTGIKEGRRVGDVVVLPITSFSPGVGHSGAGEYDDPMAFVKHEFEGTWKPAGSHIEPQKDKDERLAKQKAEQQEKKNKLAKEKEEKKAQREAKKVEQAEKKAAHQADAQAPRFQQKDPHASS